MAAAPRLLPSVVSLFSGAGGLDVGLERAGWHTMLATDHDPDCVATLASNQQARIRIAEQPQRSYLDGARIVRADVADLAAADLRPPGVTRTWRPALLPAVRRVTVASAGLQRGHDDPWPLFHMVRLIDSFSSLVLFENVRGLVTAVGPSGAARRGARPAQAVLRGARLRHHLHDGERGRFRRGAAPGPARDDRNCRPPASGVPRTHPRQGSRW